MIELSITISSVQSGGEAIGVNVVSTFSAPAADLPKAEGAVWVGLCTAINAYMRARGSPDFDCFNRMRPQ